MYLIDHTHFSTRDTKGETWRRSTPSVFGSKPCAMSESDTNLASMRSRAEALLARYGGQNGPTGHAAVNGSGEPQSLSSFIGGKAKAPRLGKLTGDGRTSSYHESDAVSYKELPGLAKPGSMASFMEQRERAMFPEVAEAKDQARVVQADAKTEATLPKRSTSGKRIVVLISGSGSNFQAVLDATCGASPAIPDAQIVRVISNRMKAFGLQRAKNVDPPIPTSVHSLKTYQTRNPGKTRDDYDLVLAERVLGDDGHVPDLVVLAGFMHIVSETFLSAMGHATSLTAPPAFAKRPARPVPIINLHPALPGAFDGANAIERAYDAFQAGDIERTGVMVHEVVAEVDRGAPILVRPVPIYKDESLDALETRMHSVEHELIVEAAAKVLSGEYIITAASCAPTSFLRLVHSSWVAVPQPLVLYDTDVLWVNGPATFVWLGRAAPATWEVQLTDDMRSQHAQIEHQGRESPDFFNAIGKTLVTQQNTTSPQRLFLVRLDQDALCIDEVAFKAQSLCSAFSAVAHTPQGLWIWHGIGSDDAQRRHAVEWSRSLGPAHKVVETSELLSLFKDKEFADGWHHRRRPSLTMAQRSVQLYSPASVKVPTRFHLADIKTNTVSLVDAYLEMYVIIGAYARGDRDAIEAAISRAERMAVREDPSHMKPPIHVIVLPSIVPFDLLSLARDTWNASVFTEGMETDDDTSPLLMNLHALAEAQRQLAQAPQTSTHPTNQNFLPVGAPSFM